MSDRVYIAANGQPITEEMIDRWCETYDRGEFSDDERTVGGLPFEMRPEASSYESLAAMAHKAELNADGVAVLPADWDDGE